MRLFLLCVLAYVFCIVVCEVRRENSYWSRGNPFNGRNIEASDMWREISRKRKLFNDSVNKDGMRRAYMIKILFNDVNKADDGWRKTSWTNIPFYDIVNKAEHYKRPFLRDKRGTGNYKHHHEGVIVTTLDGQKWLIEKGDDYASKAYYDSYSYPYTSDTIAIPWEYRVQSKWTMLRSEPVICERTIAEFMEAALLFRRYDIFLSNCQHAAERMMKLAEEKRCYIRKVGPHESFRSMRNG